jgi:hypothetical protein
MVMVVVVVVVVLVVVVVGVMVVVVVVVVVVVLVLVLVLVVVAAVDLPLSTIVDTAQPHTSVCAASRMMATLPRCGMSVKVLAAHTALHILLGPSKEHFIGHVQG